MQPGEMQVISDDTGAYLVRLDAVNPPAIDSAEAQVIREGFAAQTAQTYAQDMIDAFTRAVEGQAGIQLEQAAINAVNAQFP